MRLRFPLAILLLLAAAFVAGLTALGLLSNPQVPQGGSASFPVTGSASAANGQAWDVINSASAVIATAGSPAGWTVSLSGTTFTVGAPSTATVAANYTVRYGSGGGTGSPDATRLRSADDGGIWGGAIASRAIRHAKVPPRTRPNAGSPQPSGGQSAAFDVAAPPSPPAAPSGLTATAASSNTINLAWADNSSNETGFKVERLVSGGAGGGSTWAQIAVTAANAIAYSDTGLAASTTYSYRVRATGAGGDSAYSNVASATTAAPSLPNAPSGLTATAQSGTNVLLQWTDNSNNEDGFKLLRAPGGTWTPTGTGQPAPTVVGTVGPNQTSFVDTSASPLATYTYCVAAYDSVGQSYGNTAVLTTPSGPPPSTAGTEFWIAVPSSGPTPPTMGSPYPGPSVLVTNGNPAGSPTAHVTVTVPGLSFSQAVTVAPGAGTSVALPAGAEAGTADGVQSIAAHVTSDQAVGVQVFQYKTFASEGFTALPMGTLGTQHIVVSYPAAAGGDLNSRFAVAASANGTTVTIVPSIAVAGHAAKTPYTVSLNQGDLYQLKTTAAGQDLTGTLVSSDNPVAVVSGDQGAFVPVNVSSANPLTEATPSVDRWGLQFVAVPYATRGGDLLRIVAARNGTHVSVAGTQVATLSAGGFVDQALSAAETVSADKPILVEQMSEGSQSDGNAGADPFMTTVPALGQYGASAAWTTPPSSQMAPNYVNVAVPTNAVGDLRLDGAVVPSSSFAALGSTGYSTAQLSVANGSHVLSTPGTGLPFGAWAYGFEAGANQPGYDGYGYPTTLALPITPGFTWTPPKAPSGLAATAVSTSEIDLAWTNNATDQTGFRIERQAPDGSWAAVTNVAASATSYADTGLTKATTYSYRVVATNDLDSQPSNVASATTFDTPPAAPANLGATAVSSSEIDLSWSPGSGNEQGYYVERRTGSGAYAQVGTVTTGASFQDQGLPKLTAYTYRVRSYNAYGTSPYSNEASATTTDTPPAAPTNLTAVANSYNQVTLSWTDNANNETGFKVERSTDGGSTWFQIYSYAAVGITTYVDGTVQGATAYAYRVREYNGGGNSGYSNVATVTTPNPPAPSAPSGLTATAISSSQIQLSWSNTNSAQTGVTIQRKGGSSSTWQTVGSVAGTATSWTDSGLTAQTTYTYQIQATNVSGASSWAGPASATTLSTASDPQPPGYVAVYATSASSIRVYWDSVSNATEYRIYRRLAGQSYSATPARTVPVVNGSEHYLDDTGLTENVDYYYVVTAVVNGAESSASDEDSHFPNADAIPWNGTPQQIAAKLSSNGPQMELPYGIPYGNTDIMAPDGSILYDTGVTAQPETQIDTVNWTKIFPGLDVPLPSPLGAFEWKVPTPTPGQPPKVPTTQQAGSLRRVTTDEAGYDAVSGWFSLPAEGASSLSQLRNSDVQESACAYVGCSGSDGKGAN